jgi:hypothetical protein
LLTWLFLFYNQVLFWRVQYPVRLAQRISEIMYVCMYKGVGCQPRTLRSLSVFKGFKGIQVQVFQAFPVPRPYIIRVDLCQHCWLPWLLCRYSFALNFLQLALCVTGDGKR